MLALLLTQSRAAGIGPLGVRLPIPDPLQHRAIWHVARGPEGELAVGFEGGVAVGVPGGDWRVVTSPNGEKVKTAAIGHGRVLAAGEGFCALVQGTTLASVAQMRGDYVCAEVVPEGWLVSGSDGIWRVAPDGVAERVRAPGAGAALARLCLINREVVASIAGEIPRAWRRGALVELPDLAGFAQSQIYWADGDLLVCTKGIMARDGRRVIAEEPRNTLLTEGGIVGVADCGPVIVVATFTGGLAGYARDTGERIWTWRVPGDIYDLARDGTGLLLGTASGVYAVADPVRVRHWALPNALGVELRVEGEGDADFITAAEVIQVRGNEVTTSATTWPERDGALVRGARLEFGAAAVELPTRFVTGLAVQGDVALAGMSREIVLLSRTSEVRRKSLDGVLGAVATDGRNFLVATLTRGVHVVAPDGTVVDRIGQGRANVSEIRPGKVVLLFWDGVLLDSDANRLGRVPVGQPRDAALVQGRLAVLVTRADRGPVIGLLTQDDWRPLDVPGLEEIGAEQIAATKEYLFAAGPRGILRVRLPLEPAAPPPAEWRWSASVEAGEIRLADAGQAMVRVWLAPGAFPPAPVASLRLRLGEGGWSEFRPGQVQLLNVAAGRTTAVLQVERNGLVTESAFTVVRPYRWWLRPWAWPLHAGGLILVVLGVARLRTRQLERRTRELQARVEERTAELKQANAVKEEFLASISHEIRNPLNGVVGICQMLAERDIGPRERTLVRTLGGCADQLRSMLDDILDFSHLGRQAPVLSNADFELVALVEECARVMDPDLAACALLLPEQPCWLHGDSGKMRQILCNLISNALKYGNPREAGVEVVFGAAEGGRRRVRLAVRNTGETIPADELPRLFESFRRGARTAGVAGSGLGLAVCRRLAEAMSGHLTAASAGGVTEFAFEVVLPSAQPPVPVAATPTSVSRALAIEDEDYNRVVLGHVLRALGYSIDWAVDGASALRLAATQPYDLVLTDWRLPDMEGGQLCARLLALLPSPKPPIIAVTAYATSEKLAEAKAVGMAGFVTKPITREKLERIIMGLAGNRQPRRSLDAETPVPAGPLAALASLGDLAPSPLRLAEEITEKWRGVAALAAMRDPRTGREAHALRSLLLMAGEQAAAEQLGLLEHAADAGNWDDVQRLEPHVGAEITAGQGRLRR